MDPLSIIIPRWLPINIYVSNIDTVMETALTCPLHFIPRHVFSRLALPVNRRSYISGL